MSRINNISSEPLWKPYKPEKKNPRFIKAKTDYQWIKTRKQFLKDNPPNHQGYWVCAIDGCLTTTPEVDHIETRGSNPAAKYDPKNLRVVSPGCHRKKHNQFF